MQAQTSPVLRLSDNVPTQDVHFPSLLCGPPNEVPNDLIKGFCDTLREFDIDHSMREDTTKGSFGKNNSACHIQGLGFSTCQPLCHVIYKVLEVTIGRIFIEDAKAQVFPKGMFFIDAQNSGALALQRTGTVPRKNNSRFGAVNLIARGQPELVEDASNSVAVLGIGPSRKSKVVCKEEVGEAGSLTRNLNGVPKFGIYRVVNGPRQSFHTHYEDVRRHRIALPDACRRVEGIRGSTINENLNGTGSDAGHDEF